METVYYEGSCILQLLIKKNLVEEEYQMMKRAIVMLSVIVMTMCVSGLSTAESLVLEWIADESAIVSEVMTIRDQQFDAIVMKGNGLDLIGVGDGLWELDEVNGEVVARSAWEQPGLRFVYFRVNHSIVNELPAGIAVTLEVDYLDTDFDVASFQYDSHDFELEPREGAFKVASRIFSMGTNTWQTTRLEIADAYFAGRTNYGCDFRIAIYEPEFIFRRVKLTIEK